MMNRYTRGENDLRKKIFAYKSNYEYCSKTEIYRNFGSSKAVKKATEDAFNRASYKKAKELTILELIIANNSSRYGEMAECLPDTGYSMGEIKKVYIFLKNKKISLGEADNTRKYAPSCKFRAKHGYISAYLPARYLHARAEGGLITLRHKESSVKNIYHAEWLQLYREKKYSSVAEYTLEKGYVFDYKSYIRGWRRDETRYITYHASTIKEALSKKRKFEKQFKLDEKRARESAKLDEKRARERAKLDEKRARESAKLDEKNFKKALKLIPALLKCTFTLQDSIKAGNCLPGSLAFATRHNLSKDITLTGKQFLHYTLLDRERDYAMKLYLNRAKSFGVDNDVISKLPTALTQYAEEHKI